jgi:hypothetical protein
MTYLFFRHYASVPLHWSLLTCFSSVQQAYNTNSGLNINTRQWCSNIEKGTISSGLKAETSATCGVEGALMTPETANRLTSGRMF